MIQDIVKPKQAKPFLKWVGGKGALLPEIDKHLPEKITEYYEPFVGGGAVLFHILNKYPDLKRVLISDCNFHLINAYQRIRDCPEQVIIELEILKEMYDNSANPEKLFYQIREFFNSNNRVKILTYEAALFIFLNKTCFNGLYRVNQSGNFNTSFGKYKNPGIYDVENILVISKALQKVEIYQRNFINYNPFLKENKNTFWYIDPPYDPINKTSNFTNYDRLGFTESDQNNVYNFCRWLSNNDAEFLASNSNTPFIVDLWNDFYITEVQARRSVNCKGGKRGKVSEVLIKNYEVLNG